MSDNGTSTKESAPVVQTTQKVIHVYPKKNKAFEIFGVPITMDLVQMCITGGLGATVIGMLISEMNRRKMDNANNQTIAELQQEIADLRTTPIQIDNPSPAQPQQGGQPGMQNGQSQAAEPLADSSGMYYDYINNIDDNAVNDVNINTIRPFMDNYTDRAANIAQQQNMYQRQRKHFDYSQNGNPAKSQHINTHTDYDAELEPTVMPSPQVKDARTTNTIRQQPAQSQNPNKNMWVDKSGVVRKQAQRPEIQINMA